MIRIVLDSNVLISALFWEGNERSILEGCNSGKYASVTSHQIIKETEKVLRKKFKLPEEKIRAYIQDILVMSDMIFIKGILNVIENDPDDNMVLETALTGKADYIITGDKHLLKIKTYEEVKILKASRLLSRR